MKLRKILATTLAIAMAVAAIPATAAKADTIEGNTAYLNKEVYTFELPTTASQKFYLDPQGLSNPILGGDQTGKIIGATTMSAINNSSKPVNFEVKANLVPSSPSAIVVVTNGALATYDNVASSPAIRLDLIAQDGALPGATAVTQGGIAGATALTTAVSTGIAVSGAGITSVTYGMAPAGYSVVTKTAIDASKLDEVFDGRNYDYKRVATGSSIDFTLGGVCTTKTDWSAYGNGSLTLALDITFKVTKEDATDAPLGGFKNSSYTYSLASRADSICEFNLPSAATGAELVMNTKNRQDFTNDVLVFRPDVDAFYADGKITIKASACAKAVPGTYQFGVKIIPTGDIYWTTFVVTQ